MNWFGNVMDACKEGLVLNSKNLKLFLPYIISLLITGFLMLIFIIILSTLGFSKLFDIRNGNLSDILLSALPALTILLLVFGGILLIVYCMVEAGLLFMCKKAVKNGHTDMMDFKEGLKKYWVEVLIGLSFVGLVFILVFFVGFIFIALGEVLTFGYGFAFAWGIFNVFYGTWGVVMVTEEISAMEAIKNGYEFGGKNFWALFAIFFIPIPIIASLSVFFKSLSALEVIVVPFIVSIINTYFRLVLFKYYDVYAKMNKTTDGSIG